MPHRAARLQELLASLGHEVAAAERSKRRIGPTTARALQQFRAATGAPGVGWWVNEELFERLRAAELNKRLGSRNQFGRAQRKLLRALRIAKLDVSIAREELEARRPGASTVAAIRAFQAKYKLPATGQIDPATMDKLEAVAASRPAPVKPLKVRSVVAPLRKQARLNMTGKHVTAAQEALAKLGHAVPKAEHDAATYGKGTRRAVLAYQQAKGLAPTGHVDGPTQKALNADLLAATPDRERPEPRWRVRGSVRDELWKPSKASRSASRTGPPPAAKAKPSSSASPTPRASSTCPTTRPATRRPARSPRPAPRRELHRRRRHRPGQPDPVRPQADPMGEPHPRRHPVPGTVHL
ncbi:hypothetical protein GCM10029992_50830 [Glycomyces albus]